MNPTDKDDCLIFDTIEEAEKFMWTNVDAERLMDIKVVPEPFDKRTKVKRWVLESIAEPNTYMMLKDATAPAGMKMIRFTTPEKAESYRIALFQTEPLAAMDAKVVPAYFDE